MISIQFVSLCPSGDDNIVIKIKLAVPYSIFVDHHVIAIQISASYWLQLKRLNIKVICFNGCMATDHDYNCLVFGQLQSVFAMIVIFLLQYFHIKRTFPRLVIWHQIKYLQDSKKHQTGRILYMTCNWCIIMLCICVGVVQSILH